MELPIRVHQFVERSPEVVFDAAVAFSGFLQPVGPIPGVVSFETEGGVPLAPGVRRAVTLSDGTKNLEEVTFFERPSRHAYRWTAPPPAPLSFLLRTAHADWRFLPGPGGTEVQWTYTLVLTSPLMYPAGAILRFLFRRWMTAGLERLSVVLRH